MSKFGQVAIRKAEREDDGSIRTAEIGQDSSLRASEVLDSPVHETLKELLFETRKMRMALEILIDQEITEGDIL